MPNGDPWDVFLSHPHTHDSFLYSHTEVKPPEEGGITCHSCKDESDNDACNQEDAEICSHNKQVGSVTFYSNKEE